MTRGTPGPFPTRPRMPGPWLQCRMRHRLGWATCRQLSWPLLRSSWLLMRFVGRMPGVPGRSAGSRTTFCLRPTISALRMGRIGNSLSHLLLGLSTSLQQAQVEPALQSLSDASLQAFALMSREFGRTIVHPRPDSPPSLAGSITPDGDMQEGPQCQWYQGSFLGHLPWRHWRGLPGQGRPEGELSGLHRGMSAPSRPRGPLSPSGALSLSTQWPTEVSAACSTACSTARGGVSDP